jgi:transaldolase
MELIKTIRTIFDNYYFDCQILAASLRHPLHAVQCAVAGADVATMPLKVILAMMSHPLTDKGLAQFLADHAKNQ